MNLFEIKEDLLKAIDNAVDPETGEVLEESAFDAMNDLQMAFDEKVENIACLIKNLRAEAEALKKEKQNFEIRQRQAERRADSLGRYLYSALEGEKRDYPRASISWRKSEQVVVDFDAEIPEDYLTFTDPTPNKTELKKALKAGKMIPGVHIEEKQNIQIK